MIPHQYHPLCVSSPKGNTNTQERTHANTCTPPHTYIFTLGDSSAVCLLPRIIADFQERYLSLLPKSAETHPSEGADTSVEEELAH